ncbi:MAG: phage portal protein [Solirubrobacteraceae bacterium]
MPMLSAPLGEQTFTADTALRIGDVWAAVRVLSDAAASVPLIAYRRTPEGRTRATGHLADLLAKPSAATTQAGLIGQTMAHLNLYGNAYIGLFRDADGRVEQLALLHPDRVTPELVAGQPVYQVNDGRGHRTTHGPEDVLHIRAPLSLDGITGLSPIRSCRTALGLADGLAEHALSFFRNGARPSGILSIPDDTIGRDPAGRDIHLEQLRANLDGLHAGARNAHRVAILTGEISWTALAGPLDDLQFVEQRHLSTSDIARMFRVPPWMVGASSGDSMTYSNTESQALSFVTWSLRPWLVVIEQAFNAHPDLCPGSQYVEFLLDSLLRSDSATRADVYTKALDPVTGWMTRAEIRKRENLDPEPPTAPTPNPGALIA